MKKLFTLLFLMALLYGCVNDNYTPPPPPKYKIGAVVYLKPDSIKCVVADQLRMGNGYMYLLRYTDKDGVSRETRQKGRWDKIYKSMLY